MTEEFEIIDLASEGWFYEKSHPFSSGKARIKPFCFHIEKTLCSNNMKKRGEADIQFFKNVVVENVDVDSVFYCDYQTILLNSRILNYGKIAKYEKVTCPHCEESSSQDVSFGFKGIPCPSPAEMSVNKIELTLSDGSKIYLKLPTIKEARLFEQLSWLDFLKIIAIEHSSGYPIKDFVDSNLSVKDSRLIRTVYKEAFPGFDTVIELTCPKCEGSFKTKIDVDLSIFGFSPEYRKGVQEELFALCYHSNGAFNMDSAQNLTVSDRRFYVEQLVNIKNKEREAEQKASKGINSSKPISSPPKVKR